MKSRRRLWQTGILGLVLAGAAGCQTWVPEIGMTMPSGDYLNHPVTYNPPSPEYPLTREASSLEAAQAQQQLQARPALPVP
jgi:hypothetical protein